MKLFYVLIMALLLGGAIFLSSCGKDGENPKDPQDIDVTALKKKHSKYLGFIKDHQDADGFILTDHCDALMFSGWIGSVPGVTVNITAALKSPGEWVRRPTSYPECYPEGSKSSISRDMFTGLLWYMWMNRELELAEDLWEYGEDHNWVMGKGDLTRTFINPNFKTYLAILIYKLGGKDHFLERNFPAFQNENDGFKAELDVMLILLKGEMTNELNESDVKILKYNSERMPRNALFSYAYHKYTDGDYSSALSTLMDTRLFPSNRSPAASDRSTPWLWERDDAPKDWGPTTLKFQEHSGGDFLFVSALILRDLK